jgi:LmbE family N-acetylglucosaminyl deacetylase
MLSSPDLRDHTVLVLHAHPDDEAIFTGITLRRLAEAGARTVLVVATAGELGESRVPLLSGETIGQRRVAELERSAELLGISRLVLLGRRDSGLPGWASSAHPRALACSDTAALARRIADLAIAERAGTMIYDDEQGIYGHPDHRIAHRIGAMASRLTGAVGYRITVDRDNARGRHLVHTAAAAAEVSYGRMRSEIPLAVTGETEHLVSKYAAITAHASQIEPADVPTSEFAAVYGTEWFRYETVPGVLDLLGDQANVLGLGR